MIPDWQPTMKLRWRKAKQYPLAGVIAGWQLEPDILEQLWTREEYSEYSATDYEMVEFHSRAEEWREIPVAE